MANRKLSTHQRDAVIMHEALRSFIHQTDYAGGKVLRLVVDMLTEDVRRASTHEEEMFIAAAITYSKDKILK